MDDDYDFEYDGLGDMAFEEEEVRTPEPAPEEPPTDEAATEAACAYGSDYESDDLMRRSPAKKPKTSSRQPGGGRKKGSTSTRQVHVGPQ